MNMYFRQACKKTASITLQSTKMQKLLRRIASPCHSKSATYIVRFSSSSSAVENEGVKIDKNVSGNLKQRYLHIAPCGDFWVGTTIFAAKHLQPDYVKSIPIPEEFDPDFYFENEVSEDEGYKILNQAYDDGFLPPDVVNNSSSLLK